MSNDRRNSQSDDEMLDDSDAAVERAMATATDKRLLLLIERIERMEEEKKGVADDIKDVYAEGKAVGYDTKMMRQLIRLRKMKPDDRREMEMLIETYKAAVGLD